LRTPTTSTARRGAVKDELPVFLTKEKLTALPAWDTKGRLEDMEQMYIQLRSQFASAADSKSALEETLSLYKSQGTVIPHPI
jgi:kinesin family protein C1